MLLKNRNFQKWSSNKESLETGFPEAHNFITKAEDEAEKNILVAPSSGAHFYRQREGLPLICKIKMEIPGGGRIKLRQRYQTIISGALDDSQACYSQILDLIQRFGIHAEISDSGICLSNGSDLFFDELLALIRK